MPGYFAIRGGRAGWSGEGPTAAQLVALRFKEGALEQGLPVANVGVAWVGVELRAGTSTRSQFAAAPLINSGNPPRSRCVSTTGSPATRISMARILLA